MKTRFFEEFWRADNGFWILNQMQTYMAIGFIGILELLLTIAGMNLIVRTILAVIVGAFSGFALGMKIKEVELWRYGYATILYQIQKTINHGETVLLASSYQTQSSTAMDEDAYAVVSVQSSLPKDL